MTRGAAHLCHTRKMGINMTASHDTTCDAPAVLDSLAEALAPSLLPLREEALRLQRGPDLPLPELALSDAEAWQTHTDAEPWLLWRARRTAGRLRRLPVLVEANELVVGKPHLRQPSAEESVALEAAAEVLAAVPPFPGGDPSHFHPDYETLFRLGIGGLRAQVATLAALAPDEEARVTYAACDLALAGFSDYLRNTAAACETAAAEGLPGDWTTLAQRCAYLATEPPRTFPEALQLMFSAMIALWFGEDHALTTPGRLDQTLWPFYAADLEAGRLTPQQALDLLNALYIQCNRILWPGSAISVMVGGRDAEGRNVTNDLTYLALVARQQTHLVYPTVGVAWHEGTPPELLDFCCRMLATGVGDPALFNDEVIVAGLRDHGVSEADSYNYMNSTCVEIKVCGASNMWVTHPYVNCPRALLDVMAAVASGEEPEPEDFATLLGRVQARLEARVREDAEGSDASWEGRTRFGGFPLASCLVKDCLARGRDYDRGGARYHWVENSFVGLANLVDSLLAVRTLVYEEKSLTLAEFARILDRDYAGEEPLRRRLTTSLPCYGIGDAAADQLAAEIAHFLITTTEAQTVGGHRYVPGFFCWIQHGVLGGRTGATPDGRKAGMPFADGAGASQGRERCGPTASVLSTTSWSHRAALGGLVHNAKFPQSLLRTPAGLAGLRGVLETYLRRGGFEIQVNVVGVETLRAAQAHPEQYADLLVRVAGYSDYFVHLAPIMQEEVIARTEHQL